MVLPLSGQARLRLKHLKKEGYMKRIYLDYAAATPVDKRVLVAMQPYFAQKFYNPSSLYTPAREVSQVYTLARRRVAKLLGAKSGEVYFTAGATESINFALAGIQRMHSKSKIIISAIEHDAVAQTAGLTAIVCPVKPSGIIDVAKLETLITKDIVLVSIMLANNEIGTIQPLAKVGKLIQAERTRRQKIGNKLPIYLHSDASQGGNYQDLHVDRLRVDLLTLNGGKMYGPKQSGILYVRSGIQIGPIIKGGGQERGLRSGTENVAGAIGFSIALELAQASRDKETTRLTGLRQALLRRLLSIDGVELNGDSKQRLPNNINIRIKSINGETLVHYLDHAGVLAATGAACSANKATTSRTLIAIGLKAEQADSSLRISLGRFTTKLEIDKAAKIITNTIIKLRSI